MGALQWTKIEEMMRWQREGPFKGQMERVICACILCSGRKQQTTLYHPASFPTGPKRNVTQVVGSSMTNSYFGTSLLSIS